MDKEAYIINQFSSAYNGDDGAVIGEFIYSMDGFFEDVHFKRSWMNMGQIGRKAMLVNISDAIAMNAKPLYALTTISLPNSISNDEICQLTNSLKETAKEFGCEIIGGDTICSKTISISIVIISTSKQPLLRNGLRDGDLLAYTGTLGLVKKDLDRLLAGLAVYDDSRFYEPKLRFEFISKAREYITAGIDISDGLFCDTNKLLEASNLNMETIKPISNEIGQSGEEYEMLVGFAPQHLEQIQAIAKATQTPLSIFAKATQKGGKFECINHHFS